MIDLRAIKPRTSVNVLVISVKILVNLLVKLTKLGLGGGAMRGATPSTRASPRLYSRPDSRIYKGLMRPCETCETLKGVV